MATFYYNVDDSFTFETNQKEFVFLREEFSFTDIAFVGVDDSFIVAQQPTALPDDVTFVMYRAINDGFRVYDTRRFKYLQEVEDRFQIGKELIGDFDYIDQFQFQEEYFISYARFNLTRAVQLISFLDELGNIYLKDEFKMRNYGYVYGFIPFADKITNKVPDMLWFWEELEVRDINSLIKLFVEVQRRKRKQPSVKGIHFQEQLEIRIRNRYDSRIDSDYIEIPLEE